MNTTTISSGESTNPLRSAVLSEQGLKEYGKQRRAAVKDKTQHEHGHSGEQEISGPSAAESPQSISRLSFPQEGRDQADHRHNRAPHNEVRLKPVFALSLVPKRPAEIQAHAQQSHPMKSM